MCPLHFAVGAFACGAWNLRRRSKLPARAGVTAVTAVAAAPDDAAVHGGPLHRKAFRVEQKQELVQEGEQQGFGVMACS